MTIRFVQSSDNKYKQFRLTKNTWSTNTSDWALYSEDILVENSEYIHVKTDSEGKILWAIKADGSIYWGAGVPQQIIDYVAEKIEELSLDEYEDGFVAGWNNFIEENLEKQNARFIGKLEVKKLLEPAIKYKDQLEKLQYDIWFNEKYKYWVCDVYYETMTINENTWSKHQFVSVIDDKVIGYIAYNVDRSDNSVDCLSVINFTDDKMAFGMDLGQALKDIFEKYKFRKLNFCVVVGNPIEKSYDKMIKKYGGRIIGTKKEDVKLIDGEYYDKKIYEILATEYFDAIKNR